MESSDGLFPRFPDLPSHLQCMIWRFCLPHRVEEVGEPFNSLHIDNDKPVLCNLTRTTYLNRRPPLISRVCHVSRTVALAAGSMFHLRPNDTKYWESQWKDPARDSLHISWTPSDDTLWGSSNNPFIWRERYAKRIQQLSTATSRGDPPSLMLKAIVPVPRYDSRFPTDTVILQTQFLQNFPKWLVVMRTVIVHCDYKTAAATGLFGLLGDAAIVVVDVCKDPERADALLEFAKTCELQGQELPLLPQDFRRETPDMMKRALNDIIQLKYRIHLRDQTAAFAAIMHPAIMYRRCPRRCNRRKTNFMTYKT